MCFIFNSHIAGPLRDSLDAPVQTCISTNVSSMILKPNDVLIVKNQICYIDVDCTFTRFVHSYSRYLECCKNFLLTNCNDVFIHVIILAEVVKVHTYFANALSRLFNSKIAASAYILLIMYIILKVFVKN